jgi:hypothetical protein
MDIFTGYIVQADETNPYSVWIPAKNGGAVFKNFKSFGSNVGSFNALDLNTIQSSAEKCYMIIEPTAQGTYLYDMISGISTVQEFNASPDNTTIRDVNGMQTSANTFTMPHDGESIFSPHTNPADNGLQIYLPGSSAGTCYSSYTNAPAGHHTTLDIGTKVLVVYPDGKGVGYIIGQIPFPDETSKIIKDISN